MSKIKTVTIAAELIPLSEWKILPSLVEFLELLPLEKFQRLSINWNPKTGEMQPLIMDTKAPCDVAFIMDIISHETLEADWNDEFDVLNFKYLNETL